MPQALPFTGSLSQGTKRQRINRVNEAEFEGYSQSVPIGLNPNIDVWNVQYVPLSLADRNTLWAALDAVGASDYFTWQPPGASSTLRFKVVKDSASEEPIGDYWSISFQLRQTF